MRHDSGCNGDIIDGSVGPTKLEFSSVSAPRKRRSRGETAAIHCSSLPLAYKHLARLTSISLSVPSFKTCLCHMPWRTGRGGGRLLENLEVLHGGLRQKREVGHSGRVSSGETLHWHIFTWWAFLRGLSLSSPMASRNRFLNTFAAPKQTLRINWGVQQVSARTVGQQKSLKGRLDLGRKEENL